MPLHILHVQESWYQMKYPSLRSLTGNLMQKITTVLWAGAEKMHTRSHQVSRILLEAVPTGHRVIVSHLGEWKISSELPLVSGKGFQRAMSQKKLPLLTNQVTWGSSVMGKSNSVCTCICTHTELPTELEKDQPPPPSASQALCTFALTFSTPNSSLLFDNPSCLIT